MTAFNHISGVKHLNNYFCSAAKPRMTSGGSTKGNTIHYFGFMFLAALLVLKSKARSLPQSLTCSVFGWMYEPRCVCETWQAKPKSIIFTFSGWFIGSAIVILSGLRSVYATLLHGCGHLRSWINHIWVELQYIRSVDIFFLIAFKGFARKGFKDIWGWAQCRIRSNYFSCSRTEIERMLQCNALEYNAIFSKD